MSIPLEDCVDGMLYKLHSRNLSYGVFRKKHSGFIGLRFKYSWYLFEEYHWDTGPPFGTVKPIEAIEQVPDGIIIDEDSKKLFDWLWKKQEEV